MTKEEITEYQAKEKAFRNTPIGGALHAFVLASSKYWSLDGQEHVSYRRLRLAAEAEHAAYQKLRELLEPIAFANAGES
jgi:hypothetical protein